MKSVLFFVFILLFVCITVHASEIPKIIPDITVPDVVTSHIDSNTNGGENVFVTKNNIEISSVIADFTANPSSGIAPLTVKFTDNSIYGDAIEWDWNFGDGSAWFNTTKWKQKDPVHSYTRIGTFTTTLVVKNSSDVSSATKQIIVNAPFEAPIAAFTANPSSGTTPLTVQFTDGSTNNPTGWAWYFGDENLSSPKWTQMTSTAPWSGSHREFSLVLSDGTIVVMGYYSEPIDDLPRNYVVWYSTDKGTTWSRTDVSPQWYKRDDHNSVVLPDGSIILMGGVFLTSHSWYTPYNDVWRSTDQGLSWTQVSTSGPIWSERYSHTSVALPDGSIVLMGGVFKEAWNDEVYLNDVWRSTDKGATWTEMNSNAPWSGVLSSVVIPDSSIILMGGHKVWKSTDKGATWIEMNSNAPWSGVSFSVALPDGSIVIGDEVNSDNDICDKMWRSTDSGATWNKIDTSIPWGDDFYFHPNSVTLPDGSIIFICSNDVRRLITTGSLEKNPTHIYNSAGTYPVSLQAYNIGGYNSTRKNGYITTSVLLAPISSFFVSKTSGTAPLTVRFTDTSTGGTPTEWDWNFGDGSSWFNTTDSAQKNPEHTYTSAGTFTATLVVKNTAGENAASGTITVKSANVPTAPKITSITPGSGQQGGKATATITGTNFEKNKAKVTINGNGVTFGGYKTRNTNKIVVTFTIAKTATTGVRTVTVTNPSSGLKATKKFTVTAAPKITKITSPSGKQGKTVKISITGKNFEKGKSTVTMSGKGVSVTKYVTRNSDKIVAMVRIASSAAATKRTVTVKNPTWGVTATVATKFTVLKVKGTDTSQVEPGSLIRNGVLNSPVLSSSSSTCSPKSLPQSKAGLIQVIPPVSIQGE